MKSHYVVACEQERGRQDSRQTPARISQFGIVEECACFDANDRAYNVSSNFRQTSVIFQCISCMKHLPEGLNMCQCGVWLRPIKVRWTESEQHLQRYKLFITVHQ